MKVWVLYSGYHLKAVFATREAASADGKKMEEEGRSHGGIATIAEWDTDDPWDGGVPERPWDNDSSETKPGE